MKMSLMFIKNIICDKNKSFFSIFYCVLLVFCLAVKPVDSYGGVSFTKEFSVGNDTVYVAGNPDCYPVEYYNEETQAYEGVMPLIFARISEITGIHFTYINANEIDNRMLMAEMCRVEIVSCYTESDPEIPGLSFTPEFLTYENGTMKEGIRIAFTDLASETLKMDIENALGKISEREISEMILSYSMEEGKKSNQNPGRFWIYLLGLILAVVVLAACWSYRRFKKKNREVMMTDALTGIGNRNYFSNCFKCNIPEDARSLYAVAYISFDMEKAKYYYGEKKIQEQICFAAKELVEFRGEKDFVAKIEDAAFAIAHVCNGEESIENWIKRLILRLNRYCGVYGNKYCPYFYAGVYVMKNRDRSCSAVLNNARLGFRYAIEQGIPFAISNKELLNGETERKQLFASLCDAMEQGQFKLFLQCIVKGESGEICGAEALSRWEHPERGLVNPGEYIPLLEREGKISDLDFYMLEKTCAQLEYWEKKGQMFYISCNLTRVTISREDFIQQIERLMNKYVFERSRLILELTEDTLETNKSIAFYNIAKCKEMGLRIALDDVGDGYTFFSDLRDYPIDIVKIDSSILGNAINEKGFALLKGMITLVHNLGIDVLCEGVETERQYEMLQEMGCDYMQGFYFYRAVPGDRIEKYLYPGEFFA